ncbi:hypothetical protein HTZ84_08440 [Haloterrigena sp. SYSU A558-1]|uniref:Uncharacterized protein n=2 Tax=Haloterrigena TaxID=121871 RepID=D2RQX2_HALTV|nr:MULTISPECIES: hypothetical protein [Haloterrigena]ADB60453.1 hypothetical protein Htur_1567 [Haloterrigena turkmenica DSM 5511]NUC72337.1 hypothetical protein [Haloterrigena gelatinilytica]
MISRVYHATLFALYQLCILIGIVAMPLAIAARQAGVTLPIHRVLANVEDALEARQSEE